VTIGLALSTSSLTLSASSTEPFQIIVTARILSSHPDNAIIFATYRTPVHQLSDRAFGDIICTTKPEKLIKIYPITWAQDRINSQNLGQSSVPFFPIPPRDQGSLSIQLEVPRDKIEAANVEKRERYRVSLTGRV
jgi:hypothetical protein